MDEVKESDLLIHVVDLAHPQFEDHLKTVNSTLTDLEAIDKPTLIVFNKIDQYRERYFDKYLETETQEDLLGELKQRLKNTFESDNIFVSALTKENIPQLRTEMEKLIRGLYEKRYPYQVKHW